MLLRLLHNLGEESARVQYSHVDDMRGVSTRLGLPFL
jgi:hypothetical protein